MAYAVLEESVRLLQGEPASAHLRLSRRTRHLPVAVDRDGDVAVTLFLRRGVSGEPWLDVHSLQRTGAAWQLLGGGSGNGADRLLEPRPRLSDRRALALDLGGGRTVRNAGRSLPWGARWVRWAEVRLVAEVAALAVLERNVPVAPHGVAVVVWTSRRTPPVLALGADGSELGLVPLPDP